MHMIDVMKRLAELDAKKPTTTKSGKQVNECGPMGMMGEMPVMGLDKPSVPANFSINASAATGNEVADMMSQILTLAGMKQVGADDLGNEPQGAVVTDEPGAAVGPLAAEPMPSAADNMRSVLDKLNPEPATGDQGGDDGLGAFQHDSGAGQDSGDDGIEFGTGDDEAGSDDAGDENPFGGDDEAGSDDAGDENPFGGDDEEGADDEESDDEEGEEEETDEGQYDNSPSNPNDKPPFNSNQFAHQENQPGSGETSNGEKRQSNLPTATFENLMSEYKKFIGEESEKKEKEPEGLYSSKRHETDGQRIARLAKEKRQAEKKKEVDESMVELRRLSGLK